MNNKNSEQDITLYQQYGFQNNESEYEVDLEKSINIHENVLNKLSEAKVVGTFKPSSSGKKVLTATFSYNEGEDVPINVIVTVVQVHLTVEITKELPPKVVKNSEHPIEFLIKNTHIVDAVITGFDYGSLLKDSIQINEESIDGSSSVTTYSFEEFEEKLKKELKLDPHKQYRITAIYKVIDESRENDILFKYKESATLEDKLEQEGVRPQFLKNVTIEKNATVKVVGKSNIQKVNFKIGGEEKIEFTFTNTSSEFPATGANITIIQKAEDQAEIVKKN